MLKEAHERETAFYFDKDREQYCTDMERLARNSIWDYSKDPLETGLNILKPSNFR